MRKYIAICTPSLGKVSIHWASAFAGMARPMNTGIVKVIVEGKYVAHARNECVQAALTVEKHVPNAEVTHIFWLDDDVIAPNGVLLTLMKHDKQIASGIYFTRTEFSVPLIFDGELSGMAEFKPGEFREVWGHGMGLTLVKTSVYRRMQKELDLGVDEHGFPKWYAVEDPTDVPRDQPSSTTEDLYFLKKAHELGIPAFVDQSEKCFGWHFDLDEGVGYPKKQWEEWKKERKVTWEDGTVWTDLRY